MSRSPLALCLSMALVALGAQAAELEPLVPEGESESVAQEARWAAMGSVGAVAFSPDGSVLASGDSDGRVRLWEVSTGRELHRLSRHTDSVQSLAFSPDGQTLASGGDNSVWLWELRTGQPLHRLEGHSDAVRFLVFSPDGRTLASGGADKAVRLWEVSTGKALHRMEGLANPVLAFSPDGKLLASGGDASSKTRFWEVASGREQNLERKAAGKAFAPRKDASWLREDLPVAVTRATLLRLQRPAEPVLVFSPDESLMATGGSDERVRVWHALNGQELRRMEGHTHPVQSLAFSPDGRILASGGTDNTVRLWDVATGHALWRLEGNTSPVSAVAFAPGGHTLASGGSDTLVHLWDRYTGRESQRLAEHRRAVRTLAFHPQGHLLASSGEDAAVILWNAVSGVPEQTLQGGTAPVRCLAFSADGQYLAVGGDEKKVRVWDTQKRTSWDTMDRFASPVLSLAFHPTEPLLAVGDEDGRVYLDEFLRRDSQAQRVFGEEGAVRALAFSPDGRILAAAGSNGNAVRLWDVSARRELRRLKGLSSGVWTLAFSPDGNTLAAAGGNRVVQLWDVRTGRTLRRLEGHTDWIKALAFSSDGLSLASAADDGEVRLWSPQDGQPLLGVLRASRQGWLAHLGPRVLRHEDGRFLQRSEEGLQPIPPPQPEGSPRLTVSASVEKAPGDFGEPGELVLTVFNASDAARAYWIRIEPVSLPDDVRLVPSAPIARLDAGQSTKVRVGLSYLRRQDAPLPKAPQVRLQLIHAFGEGPTVDVPIEIRAPELALVEPPRIQDNDLVLTLENTGNQPTGKLLFGSYFVALGEGPYESGQLAILEDLPPGEKRELELPVSSALFDARRVPFSITANYERWARLWTSSIPEVKVPIPYFLYLSLSLGAVLLLGFVYYASVYRNPVVVHAARAPASLKNYPLVQMVAADQALRRARRLDSTITAAGIPVTRWKRALRGAKAPADAATAFAEAIGGRLGARLDATTWALSLPPLRLRFTRDTALLIVDGTRLESGEAERRMADVFQEGRGPSQVLVLDRTHTQNVRQVLEGVPRVRGVVLSANRLRDLLLDDEPARLLETTIAEQVAVSELSPYQVAGGVKLENLFFGRERELRAMADRTMRNFLVVGQRQMGKSSLLLAVLRRLQARPDLDAHYVELADADLHRRLARERERMPAEGSPLPPFEEMATGVPSRPRVWLIDEADDFISTDARAGYPVLQAMRALAEEGRAYFILAGFWDLYRAVVLDEKQPLRNFGEHLRLEPLDPRSALALVTEPMAALNLAWDAPSTPELLVEQAGRRANLLVLVCKALVETLPPDTHVLTREHLERVLREDKDLRDQGRRWRGDHPLHRAVVRQALRLGRPTREEVRQALKARGADIRAADFDEAMDHRELSYVLVPDGEGRLSCPVPLMQRYIETERGLEAGLTEDLEDLRRRGLSEVPPPA